MPNELATLISCATHVNVGWKWHCSIGLYNLRPLGVRSARILDLPHERSLGPYALKVINDGEPHVVALVNAARMHEQRVRKKHLFRPRHISVNKTLKNHGGNPH